MLFVTSLTLLIYTTTLTAVEKQEATITIPVDPAEDVVLCMPRSSKFKGDKVLLRASKNIHLKQHYPLVECIDDFVQIGDGCYHVAEDYHFSYNHLLALKKCLKYKSDLVSFETEEEFFTVFNYVSSLSSTITYSHVLKKPFKYWTSGAKDKDTWKWGNKKPLTGPWCKDNNDSSSGGGDQYAVMCDLSYEGCLCISNNPLDSGNYICEAKKKKKS